VAEGAGSLERGEGTRVAVSVRAACSSGLADRAVALAPVGGGALSARGVVALDRAGDRVVALVREVRREAAGEGLIAQELREASRARRVPREKAPESGFAAGAGAGARRHDPAQIARRAARRCFRRIGHGARTATGVRARTDRAVRADLTDAHFAFRRTVVAE